MLKHLREYIDFDNYDIDETYDSPLTDKEFVIFLKDNNIYDKFIDNLYRDIEKGGKYYGQLWHSVETFCDEISNIGEGRPLYIVSAFVWDKTPEKFDFWKHWHYRWFNRFQK